MTSGEGDAVDNGRRGWLFVMAAAWALLGLWSLADDSVALGSCQLGLGGLNLLAAMSPRVGAALDSPVFRRK